MINPEKLKYIERLRDERDAEYWKFYRCANHNPSAMLAKAKELHNAEVEAGIKKLPWQVPWAKARFMFNLGTQEVHKRQVIKAIKANKFIPEETKADYPELFRE